MPTKPAKPKPRKKPTAKTRAKKQAKGRPSKFTPAIAATIIDQLSKGVPMSIICKSNKMPGITTVWEWQKKDEAFSESIARAREAGFDQIAQDALNIADEVTAKDTIETKFGEIPNKEWLLRSKLRVETRLKLLAKWDPKRYGDKITQEISGPDGKPIKSETSHRVSEELQEQILQKTAEAARIAANVMPPASFRGEDADE